MNNNVAVLLLFNLILLKRCSSKEFTPFDCCRFFFVVYCTPSLNNHFSVGESNFKRGVPKKSFLLFHRRDRQGVVPYNTMGNLRLATL